MRLLFKILIIRICACVNTGSADRGFRASSVPPLSPSLRASSLAPAFDRAARATSIPPLDSFLSEYDQPTKIVGALSPTPVKGRWGPRDSEVGYDSEGKSDCIFCCHVQNHVFESIFSMLAMQQTTHVYIFRFFFFLYWFFVEICVVRIIFASCIHEHYDRE